MKKISLFFISMCLCLGINAQVFEGTYKDCFSVKWAVNEDEIVAKYKASVDDNPEIPAASKAMAKMMAKPLVKNMMGKMEIERYISQYPDGKYNCYMWVDATNNRSVAFCPELGRIIVRNPSEGKDRIIFPKLGIGCEYEYPASETAIKDVFTTTHIQDPKENSKVINGVNCVPGISVFSYEQVGGELVDTITYKGVLCVKIPANGYVHADYQMLPIQRTTENAFLSVTENIRNMKDAKIDTKNFVLPEDIDFKDYKKLAKEIKKIVNDGETNEKLAIPYDGEIPALVWDIIKK